MSKSKTGSMNIKPGKISYTIHKWMQENEGTPALKRTTGHIIAGKICELDDVTNGELTIEQTFSKMVKCSVIYRDQYDKSIFSDYRINYWHKSIPADILANAPVEVKRAMAKTIDDMQPGQYMDDEGAVVTPNAVEKNEDPFSEATPLMPSEKVETPMVTVEKPAVNSSITNEQFAKMLEMAPTGASKREIAEAIGKNPKTLDYLLERDRTRKERFYQEYTKGYDERQRRRKEWLENGRKGYQDKLAYKARTIAEEMVKTDTTQNVTLPLDIKKDGKQITVNLSLTINL